MSAGGRVQLENGHPLPHTRTLLSYAEAIRRFHVRLSAA
jgi:hypothetical protein